MTTENLPMNRLHDVVAAAEQRHATAIIETTCMLVGIGVRTLQSRERTADTARRRAIVAWILCDRLGWPQAKAAVALGRTTRQVKRLLRTQR